MNKSKINLQTAGFLAFMTVWFGQVISFIGSGLTSFALGVHVYRTTGSITLFALISLCAVLPGIIIGPLAGSLIDRWDRRLVMIVSDVGAGLSSLAIFLVLLTGQLQLWQIYVAVGVSGIFGALRGPALSAATTQLVPKEQFGRANGLLEIVSVGQFLISPLLAGALIGSIGLRGIILIDFSTFLFALLSLQAIRIPRPEASADGLAGKGSLLQEAAFGWKYIAARPGLLGLMLLFAVANFTTEMSMVLFTPLFLSFASPAALGTALSLAGIGYLAGGILMSVWGGGKQRIPVMLVALLVLGVFMGAIGLRASTPFIIVCIFVTAFCSPVINSASQAIWQSKVAPDVQGRVFSIKRMIVMATPLAAYLLAGPLADRVFEPLLRPQGALAASLGQIIGIGPGRGIALIFIIMGILLVLVTGFGVLLPHLRRVESELPDGTLEEKLVRVQPEGLAG
jgi:MFS transporter, DHA3 family, macrolide efflux protein